MYVRLNLSPPLLNLNNASFLRRWDTRRDEVVASAEDILGQLRSFSRSSLASSGEASLDIPKLAKSARSKLFADLSSRYDSRYGGFSEEGPKFPSPAQSLDFLAIYAALPETNNVNSSTATISADNKAGSDRDYEARKRAAHMAVRTLRGIWEGGIRDHVGGGIARYSVDERWHVPHFEKMLYDQAQLAYTSLSLSLLPPDILSDSSNAPSADAENSRSMLRELASNILEYSERELLDKTPGRSAFWSAEDADSKEKFGDVGVDGKRQAIGPSLGEECLFHSRTS